MDYRKKLEQFNSTEKYKREMAFITTLLNPKEGDVVFDYGAGLGALVDHIIDKTEAYCFGYDKCTYGEIPSWYRESIYFDVDKVTFCHSIAHIDGVEGVLFQLRDYLTTKGEICVITPNKEYLKQVDNKNYLPDPTVIKHYSMNELESLFTKCGYRVKFSGQFGEQVNGYNERIFLVASK